MWRTKPVPGTHDSSNLKNNVVDSLNNDKSYIELKEKAREGSDSQNGGPFFTTRANYYEDNGPDRDYMNTNEVQVRPWYFSNGERYPKRTVRSRKTQKRVARLFPNEDPQTDRIQNQLMFIPPNYEKMKEKGNKMILLYNGLNQWHIRPGREVFLNNKCPVDSCTITGDRSQAASADMLLYKDHYIPPNVHRTMNQIYMMYFLECPFHTQNVLSPDAFNWTSTYRKESDIVAPYEKWVYYDPRVKQIEQERNYALNKTKKVAWFVSNCNARNNRLQYAHELQKYIDVSYFY